jgi:ATP-dependent RNA helicase DDX52/ROK1
MTSELKSAEMYAKKYDIIITTPNKLIFLLENNLIKQSLKRVEWMVIDEADRLFEDGEQGFREQLATIYKACDNPKIKHALFSATLTNDVQEWFKNFAHNLVEISIGRK